MKTNRTIFLLLLLAGMNLLNPIKSFSQDNPVFGIGVMFKMDPDQGMIPVVTEVVNASSAQVSGIQKGWHIIAVDNVRTIGKTQEQIVNMIRGKQGTYVKLLFMTNNNPKDNVELTIMRRKIPAHDNLNQNQK